MYLCYVHLVCISLVSYPQIPLKWESFQKFQCYEYKCTFYYYVYLNSFGKIFNQTSFYGVIILPFQMCVSVYLYVCAKFVKYCGERYIIVYKYVYKMCVI